MTRVVPVQAILMRGTAATGIAALILLGGFVALPTAPPNSKMFWAKCQYGRAEFDYRMKKFVKSGLRQAVEGRLRWLGLDGDMEYLDALSC